MDGGAVGKSGPFVAEGRYEPSVMTRASTLLNCPVNVLQHDASGVMSPPRTIMSELSGVARSQGSVSVFDVRDRVSSFPLGTQ